MHEEGEVGRTVFANAVAADAPVELLAIMVKLGKRDTKKRNIVRVCDRDGWTPLYLAATHSTDTASIKLLASEGPVALYPALKDALKYENTKNTAVVPLLSKCLAAWEHGNISALIDLCGESDVLLGFKKYVERHPVHFAAMYAGDNEILKPLIREHAPELLTEDEFGRTPLYRAKLSENFLVVSFMTLVNTAFSMGNYLAQGSIEERISENQHNNTNRSHII